MVNSLKSSLLILAVMILPISVFADYYRCSFTEPFRSLLISTNHSLVTIIDAGLGAKTVNIKAIEDIQGVTNLSLQNGEQVSIYRKKIGNDGMSDFNYPYEVVFEKQYGACEKSLVHYKTEVELWKSMNYSSGYTFTHFWPGEYGWAMGISILSDFSVPLMALRNDLRGNIPADKKCTLKKGKVYSPQLRRANEVFGYLDVSHNTTASQDDSEYGVKKGDPLKYLSYLSENFCLYEQENGQLVDLACIDHEVEKSLNLVAEVPMGQWIFAKCKEGYYNWIHVDSILGNKEIEDVFLGL